MIFLSCYIAQTHDEKHEHFPKTEKEAGSEKSPQAGVGNGTADRFVFIRYLNALQ